MPWHLMMAAFFGALMFLLLLRVPVAFALFGVTMGATVLYYGIEPGARMLTLSTYNSLISFSLVPIVLFLFMGDLLFKFGIASRALIALSNLFGRVPARLGLLTTSAGALFGLLSGSSIANTALLGKTFLGDMRREGYRDTLAMGTIMAGGGLAMIIPPSTLAIVWAVTAGVPIGPVLIAGIIPGCLMAVGYAIVTVVWGKSFGAAPANETVASVRLREKAREVVVAVLPLSLIIFMALGLIFLGIATPTEASAMGALAALLLVICYRRFKLRLFMESLRDSAKVSGMLLLILGSSQAYSQLMSFSGATRGFIDAITGFDLHPLVLLLLIQIGILILGTFLEQIAIMLVTLPLLMPLVDSMGWDPVWFGILMLINLHMALTTPPFGMELFVMRGVIPAEIRTVTIYKAALPFLASDAVIIVILAAFPILVTYLPGVMG